MLLTIEMQKKWHPHVIEINHTRLTIWLVSHVPDDTNWYLVLKELARQWVVP